MQAARLHLVKSQHMRFAEDRDNLLRDVSIVTGFKYLRPLDAIPDLVRLMEFKLRYKVLPQGRLGWLDVDEDTVWICSRLADKLDYRQSAREVDAFTRAHEFAHLRMHLDQLRQGIPCTKQQEADADSYAGTFLVPEQQLRGLQFFRGLLESESSGEISGWASRIASHFGVSRWCVVVQLQKLGIVEIDRSTNQLRLVA